MLVLSNKDDILSHKHLFDFKFGKHAIIFGIYI
jgi:hypothetical protein